MILCLCMMNLIIHLFMSFVLYNVENFCAYFRISSRQEHRFTAQVDSFNTICLINIVTVLLFLVSLFLTFCSPLPNMGIKILI